MNWRAGFLRIWLLMSAAWVVLVLLLYYGDIARPWFPARGLDYTSGPWTKHQPSGQSDRRSIKEFLSEIAPLDNPGNSAPEPRMVERYSAEYRALEGASAAGSVKTVEFQGLPEIVLFVPAGIPEADLDALVQKGFAIASRVKKLVVDEKRREAIQAAALVGAIPPIALLLLGWAITWVLAGFRNSRPDS